MSKLEKEKVLHVAKLAKLEVKDEEIEKYSTQLGDILSEIEKIVSVDIPDNLDIMISPTDQEDVYSETPSNHLSKEDLFKNVPNSDEDYVIVPKVIE